MDACKKCQTHSTALWSSLSMAGAPDGELIENRKRLRCENSFGIFIKNKKATDSGVDISDTFF
jgi:hypothetical protein